MHWAYLYMKNIIKFCPPRWYRYVKIWVLAHGLVLPETWPLVPLFVPRAAPYYQQFTVHSITRDLTSCSPVCALGCPLLSTVHCSQYYQRHDLLFPCLCPGLPLTINSSLFTVLPETWPLVPLFVPWAAPYYQQFTVHSITRDMTSCSPVCAQGCPLLSTVHCSQYYQRPDLLFPCLCPGLPLTINSSLFTVLPETWPLVPLFVPRAAPYYQQFTVHSITRDLTSCSPVCALGCPPAINSSLFTVLPETWPLVPMFVPWVVGYYQQLTLPCCCRFYIGCDRCQDWFHGSCVGVTKSEADQMDTYICPTCQRTNLAQVAPQRQLSARLKDELKRLLKTLQVSPSTAPTLSVWRHDVPILCPMLMCWTREAWCANIVSNANVLDTGGLMCQYCVQC